VQVPPQDKGLARAPVNFDFLGLELGHYESEWSVYSCVLHEIIYGINEGMRSYANHLNDSLLLPDGGVVSSVQQTREALLREGADKEAALEMAPMAIFGQNG